MRKTILNILLATAMVMGASTTMHADPIVEVNSIDFNHVGVTYSNGVLHVTGAAGLVVSVYNIVGQKVYECKLDSNDKRIELSLFSSRLVEKRMSVRRRMLPWKIMILSR